MLFKEDQLYNQKEVAERLRVTPWTVWRLCRDGVLPPMLPGLKFYSGTDLQRVVSSYTPWVALKAAEEREEEAEEAPRHTVQVVEVCRGRTADEESVPGPPATKSEAEAA